MILLPIGRDDAVIRRHAWVSYSIIGLNIFVWLAMAVYETAGGSAHANEQWVKTMRFFIAHPYLHVPPSIDLLVPPSLKVRVAATATPPAASVDVQGEQATFDGMAEDLERAYKALPSIRFGYTPAEGGVVRIFTTMFIHLGFLHLFGNLLFFFISGPFVEDVFGRPLFAFLYLSGGVVATLVFAAKHPGSNISLVGASGAIAAVMGAYLVRFLNSKVEFILIPFLLVWRWNFRFHMPAFVVLPLWFAQQFYLTTTETSGGGTAFSAHVGGFLYGVVIALMVRLLGIEEKFVAPLVEKETTWKADDRLVQAVAARDAGDLDRARTLIAALLAEQPRNIDALRFALDGAVDERARDGYATRLLARDIEEKHDDSAVDLIRELQAERLPHFLARAAQFAERRGQRDWAIVLYESLCDIETTGVNAIGPLVKLGTLRKLSGDAAGARDALTRARHHPDCSPEWAANVEAKLQQLA
jgi:membrane associated rhomboid family serine protease